LFSVQFSLNLAAMRATVLIATDVFGNTPAIASLCRQLNASCLIVNPFEADFQVQTEQQAYQAFLASGGVAAYAKKIRALIEQQTQLKHVIGFSVGASAWWMNSAECSSHLVTATLFYGSRIRNYLEIPSRCPTHFIFAEHEAAFQVDQVVKNLQQRGHQAEIALACKHGFMNPYSSGFSLKNQTHYLEILSQKINIPTRTQALVHKISEDKLVA
jgi:dienelactone hydrolase